MSSYSQVMNARRQMVDKLAPRYGLDKKFVDSVFTFANCMADPEKQKIDHMIFEFVMCIYFDIIDPYLLRNIYSKTTKGKPGGLMTVEDFARIICIFYTKNLDNQIDFVFWTYDYNNNGCVEYKELVKYIKSSCRCMTDTDTNDRSETIFDLVTLSSKILNVGIGASIDKETFRKKARQDTMLLCILGPIIPSSDALSRFKEKINFSSRQELREKFGNLRQKYLYEEPRGNNFNSYPVALELP